MWRELKLTHSILGFTDLSGALSVEFKLLSDSGISWVCHQMHGTGGRPRGSACLPLIQPIVGSHPFSLDSPDHSLLIAKQCSHEAVKAGLKQLQLFDMHHLEKLGISIKPMPPIKPKKDRCAQVGLVLVAIRPVQDLSSKLWMIGSWSIPMGADGCPLDELR
eukprot:Gb_07849 [translate_table: standard]